MRMPATEIEVEIGARLRSFRIAKGLSLQFVGDAVGVGYQQIQKYEKGSNRCSVSMLCRLAEALDVEVTMLIPSSNIDMPDPRMILIARGVGKLPDHVREPLLELIETVIERSRLDR